ncbi:hypothetical protein AB4Y30_14645 [Ornithinibacillus sp. 4-3]|uniref:Uncharacterized protein n=1 Tax=Ornithinibacillus sp. 4-3 TaxID=3231488 RepID=A0AB39HPP0_9BACI
MNNRVITSLLAVGAAGATIYGIRKGIQNGTFQRLPQQLSNAMNNPAAQQFVQNLGTTSQDMQQLSSVLDTDKPEQQGETNNLNNQ